MDWVDNKPKNTKNLNGNNSSFHVTLSATLDLEIDACLYHKYINLIRRARVPGFSNCSMTSLQRLNDWCLYNVPTHKVHNLISRRSSYYGNRCIKYCAN